MSATSSSRPPGALLRWGVTLAAVLFLAWLGAVFVAGVRHSERHRVQKRCQRVCDLRSALRSQASGFLAYAAASTSPQEQAVLLGDLQNNASLIAFLPAGSQKDRDAGQRLLQALLARLAALQLLAAAVQSGDPAALQQAVTAVAAADAAAGTAFGAVLRRDAGPATQFLKDESALLLRVLQARKAGDWASASLATQAALQKVDNFARYLGRGGAGGE